MELAALVVREWSAVVVVGEFPESLFYGCGDVSRQRHFGGDGLHLWCVVTQQFLLYESAVSGFHHHHVYVEVGNDEGVAVGVGENDFAIYVSFLVSELQGAWCSVCICLRFRLKVSCGMCSELFFERAGFVGCSFLSSSCFSSLCHGD